MEIAFLVGRIVFSLYLLFNAGSHFFQMGILGMYAESKKVPAPMLAVSGSGLLLLMAGLSLGLGLFPVIGIISVITFMVPVAFIMHNFWAIEDDQMQVVELANFTKNLALAAASLMFLAIPTPWPFSLGTL